MRTSSGQRRHDRRVVFDTVIVVSPRVGQGLYSFPKLAHSGGGFFFAEALIQELYSFRSLMLFYQLSNLQIEILYTAIIRNGYSVESALDQSS